MKPSDDYPRMLFHRTKEAVVVHSRTEEDALGAEWRRTIWPLVSIPAALTDSDMPIVTKEEVESPTAPEPQPEPVPEEPDEQEDIRSAPHPSRAPDEPPKKARPKPKPPAAKSKLPAMRPRRR